MTISENIRRLRTERNLSQEQLAEMLSVSRQSVSKWETAKANPDMDKIIQMANLFGVSLLELMGTDSGAGPAEENSGESSEGEQEEKERAAWKQRETELTEQIGRLRNEVFFTGRRLFRWRLTAVVLILALAVLVCGGLAVVNRYYPQIWDRFSSQSVSGDAKSVKMTHENLYEDGIDGILEDLGEVIDFPQYLTLQTSFNLHFAPDGTITSLDTMWYGYDECYTYVDSYLITFDRTKSKKITVYFGGGTGDAYDPDKDLTVLFDAMRVIPFEDTVSRWEEPEYGILYLGQRDWGYNTEGILYIDRKGTIDVPSDMVKEEIVGPTVSVFCPQDDTITPVRYLFCEDNSEEANVR